MQVRPDSSCYNYLLLFVRARASGAVTGIIGSFAISRACPRNWRICACCVKPRVMARKRHLWRRPWEYDAVLVQVVHECGWQWDDDRSWQAPRAVSKQVTPRGVLACKHVLHCDRRDDVFHRNSEDVGTSWATKLSVQASLVTGTAIGWTVWRPVTSSMCGVATAL